MKFKKFLILFLFLNYSFIFSQAPIVSADGIQLYCPGTKLHVATSFSITPAASETGQIGLYIQISQGYVNGEDTLSLLNPANFPDINKDWSATEGKLTLTHITNPEILAPNSRMRKVCTFVCFKTTDSPDKIALRVR